MATPASIRASTEAMVARVQKDLDALKATIAATAKPGLTPAEQADLDAAEANINALDPTNPATLP